MRGLYYYEIRSDKLKHDPRSRMEVCTMVHSATTVRACFHTIVSTYHASMGSELDRTRAHPSIQRYYSAHYHTFTSATASEGGR